MIDMCFSDADQHDRHYNKEYKEYAQGKKQVSLVCVNIFGELLEHDLIIYLLFYLP